LCIYGVVALIRNMSREERLDPDSALLIFIYGEGASSVNPEKLEMALRIMGHEGLGIKIVPVPEEPQAAHESKEAGNETLGEASYEELENFSLISDKNYGAPFTSKHTYQETSIILKEVRWLLQKNHRPRSCIRQMIPVKK
jgi:hypothetical protein